MALAGVVLACLGCGTPEPAGPPNVILISMDGVRADKLGVYGDRGRLTPTMDGLAAQGVRWRWAFSQSEVSRFSNAALLTGRPVPELAAPDIDRFALTDQALLISEVLVNYGYATAAFMDGAPLGAGSGFDQGFGAYDQDHGELSQQAPQALAWLDARERQPFLLVLQAGDCRQPGGAPDDAQRDYDGRLRAADAQLGLLLRELEQRDLLDNTVIALTAGHGSPPVEPAAGPALRDDTTHVPLILAGEALPKGMAGTERADLTQAIDLLPTLLALAGAQAPATTAGRDLLAVPTGTDRAFQVSAIPEVSVRTPTHRLVFSGTSPASSRFEERLATAAVASPEFALYDLRRDPGETTNLIGEQPELAVALRDELLLWWRGLDRSGHRELSPQDPALLEALRARGYW
jgi:arylsulfatase A-like enzyme